MKTLKFSILSFYIKNIVLSFLGLVLIAGIVIFILDNAPASPPYTYIGIGSSILVAMFGAIIIGYCNASSASKEKGAKPLYLHIVLIILLLITNTIGGDLSFLNNLLRELYYFIFLQIGVYLYIKRKAKISQKFYS
jgi:hypothetical protein